MNISIINEVLIIVDDQDTISVQEIKILLKNKSLQSISSALGRLNSKGWIKLISNNDDKTFKITKLGKDEISSNLSRIREYENNTWDNEFYVLIFKIPEKIRKSRDILRKKLNEAGYCNLMGDLWISFWNKDEYISKIIKDLNIDQMCISFCINSTSSSDLNKIINKLSWNDKFVENQYKNFIALCNKFLKNPKHGYLAKLLVYSYSKILAYDPKFPKKYSPKNYLGEKAYELYSKVRPYCYK